MYLEIFYIGYGLMENGGVIVIFLDICRGDMIVIGDVGVFCEGVEIKIIDDIGSILLCDYFGEFCIRS